MRLDWGEAGLDQYGVRHWHSRRRHVTHSLAAYAFLASLRQRANGIPATRSGGGGKISEAQPASAGDRTVVALSLPEAHKLLALALPWPPCPLAHRLHWPHWHRRHQLRALLNLRV